MGEGEFAITEQDFWGHLEYRVCREFRGLPRTLGTSGMWCDGFLPSRYYLTDFEPRIEGKVWICRGPEQSEWDFTLFLPQAFGSIEAVDWWAILPPEHTTCWLAFDMERRYLELEPAVAVPDL